MHYAGDAQVALRYAEQANQLNEQGEILFRLVDTALILGHTRMAVGQWAAAAMAFQQALAAFTELDKPALAAEAQAGLAQIALAQGDLASAQAQIVAMLPVLAEQPHAGYNNSFFIYLTGYHVLTASGDPRAATILRQGYELLQQDAAALDEEGRRRFLTGVAIHRDLVATYEALQAQHDKARSEGATSDKVTDSSNYPATPSSRHNLPATLTPFVGRTRSLAEVLSRLQEGGRLLTLVGPGGMGKTRLALAVGQRILDLRADPLGAHWDSIDEVGTADEPTPKFQTPTFPDGVWFVALAALTNPAALATAIASALRLPLAGDDPRTALMQLLQPKRLLLILDNFEQLLVGSTEGAELVAAVLQAAPGVQMLITSRERLQLRSEQLYQVPPLSVAPNATLAEATASSAARLFV
ncbi:MAG: AAA family ATPase, partial [Caldilineaceae bacterium]|nr:AAA family ATPase [Caldilineaceae bacterium]